MLRAHRAGDWLGVVGGVNSDMDEMRDSQRLSVSAATTT
ncbi:MAG: hypothetical protein OJF49_003458 [Ktedonobacterales bacterium]|nr:MAG: hypothetical protein OJF49_003458 [Ktedonobacterales bacterium]